MVSPAVEKIDRLLQFILAAAGQEDFGGRELGPIHLVKYLYLADLEHAKHRNGETYTNLPWKFHHFGPWSPEAYLRIEPALRAVGADKKAVALANPKYEGEFVRWHVENDELFARLEKELPLIVAASVQKYVHEFNSITEDLLHFVYKTFPMLVAKPGETLDFSVPDFIRKENEKNSGDSKTIPEKLTARQQKKKKAALEELKKEFRKRLEEKKRRPKIKLEPPVYDNVYFEGLKTLDSLAGEEIKEIEGIARFSDDIWKSKARFDPDVP